MSEELAALGLAYSQPSEPAPAPAAPAPTEADILRLSRAFAEPAPVRKAAKAFKPSPLAQAVKTVLARERAQRQRLERQVEALRTELVELRAEVAVSKRLDDIGQRLDKLEAIPARGAGLRAV